MELIKQLEPEPPAPAMAETAEAFPEFVVEFFNDPIPTIIFSVLFTAPFTGRLLISAELDFESL
jgi:hypothetical protein